MTQLASPETVLGNFDNQLFTFPGSGTYRLVKTGDKLWVESLTTRN